MIGATAIMAQFSHCWARLIWSMGVPPARSTGRRRCWQITALALVDVMNRRLVAQRFLVNSRRFLAPAHVDCLLGRRKWREGQQFSLRFCISNTCHDPRGDAGVRTSSTLVGRVCQTSEPDIKVFERFGCRLMALIEGYPIQRNVSLGPDLVQLAKVIPPIPPCPQLRKLNVTVEFFQSRRVDATSSRRQCGLSRPSWSETPATTATTATTSATATPGATPAATAAACSTDAPTGRCCGRDQGLKLGRNIVQLKFHGVNTIANGCSGCGSCFYG
ncbi:hypothetical protein OUZ56_005988 [Daphnia magna]|uniref:Uncharacterized protein n=1 Tax=Daphnia magna TaxID=35525 RepID=A0ABQ9YUF2_9CRUS|nr:hypothetical protein OUZ56_005988 [Daphnia magna]